MKCLVCNGTGVVHNALGDFDEDCGNCFGTGEYIPFDADAALDELDGGITNEEYIRNCSTEELAETIAERIINSHTMFEYILHQDNRREKDLVREVREWLEEVHDEMS